MVKNETVTINGEKFKSVKRLDIHTEKHDSVCYYCKSCYFEKLGKNCNMDCTENSENIWEKI